MVPSPTIAATAPLGTAVDFLTFGSSRSGQFAQITSGQPLPCPRQFGASYQDAAKKVSAVVADSGSKCGGEEGGGTSGGGSAGGAGPAGGSGSTTNPPAPLASPNTRLGSHPRARIKTRKAKITVTFTFAADLPGVTFRCKLDNGPARACTSPKTYKVKPGKHTFSVQSVHPAGGTDPSPATFSFTVVRTARGQS